MGSRNGFLGEQKQRGRGGGEGRMLFTDFIYQPASLQPRAAVLFSTLSQKPLKARGKEVSHSERKGH